MANKKYELVKDDTIKANGKTLYRIRATKTFKFEAGVIEFSDTVNKGEEGGYIESEKNLSQEGDCWVMGDAMVYGKAKVYDDAVIAGDAMVYGNAEVFHHALVQDTAKIYGKAKIYGRTTTIMNNAKVYDNADVSNSTVMDNAKVYNNAVVELDSVISGNAEICKDSVASEVEINDGVHDNMDTREMDLTPLQW